MSRAQCGGEQAFAELLAYWFDEVTSDRARALEEHVFDCERCSERLQQIASLAERVERIAALGGVHAITTPAFVQRLKRNGVRVREYRLQPSGSVLCTIMPEDDLVVAHLAAPLDGIGRLDVVVHDPNLPAPVRFQDVPFDAAAGVITVSSETAGLRRLGTVTQRVALVAVDGAREHTLANYTFNHAPYQPRA